MPDFKGLEKFQGKWYHTGLWPHEGVDFAGLRVGVIGTGSSGVQMIPQIAAQADHLTVFQRTANFSLPARNAPLDPEQERRHKQEYEQRRRAALDTPFGIGGYPAPTKSALEVTEQERQRAYEQKWAEGGSISFLYSYSDLLVNKASNDTASEFVRQKIRGIVRNPVTAEILAPKDHPIGTKRLCLDTNYYETYNRNNVSLIDVKSDPIHEITRTGVRTRDHDFGAVRRARLRHRLRRHDRRIAGNRHSGRGRRRAGRAVGSRPAHLPGFDGGRLSEHVRHHRSRQPIRKDADDRRHRAAH